MTGQLRYVTSQPLVCPKVCQVPLPPHQIKAYLVLRADKAWAGIVLNW